MTTGLLRAVRGRLHEVDFVEVATPVLCQDRGSAPIPHSAALDDGSPETLRYFRKVGRHEVDG